MAELVGISREPRITREEIIIQLAAAWIPVMAARTNSHNQIVDGANNAAIDQADKLIKLLNL